MAIGVGATSKGRIASASSIASTGVTTQVSGSAILLVAFWGGTATFTSVADNKGNSANYIQIDTDITIGGASHCRAYYCPNAAGGAGHTATLTLSGTTPGPGIMFLEITGGVLTSSILDQHNRRDDTATPFTLAAGLTTTQAAELLVTALIGDSGSNPATMAESGLGSSTIQTSTQETDGSQFFAAAMATAIKSSTGTFNPSWTQTGASNAATWLFTFKEAAAAAGTSGGRLALLGVGS